MKILVWEFNRKKPRPEPVTYTTEFHQFIRDNAPVDFKDKMQNASPFIVASFLSWPMFWMYRGLDWSSQRHLGQLNSYVNRTFLQAKAIQIAIIAAGILFTTFDNSARHPLVQNMEYNRKKTKELVDEVVEGGNYSLNGGHLHGNTIRKMVQIWEAIRGLFRKEEPNRPTNFGEELRKVVQSQDFEYKVEAAAPFLLGSAVAWPSYWIYRALDWRNRRSAESLHVYIRKTFYQAKIMQMALITTGIIAVILTDPNHIVLEPNRT